MLPATLMAVCCLTTYPTPLESLKKGSHANLMRGWDSHTHHIAANDLLCTRGLVEAFAAPPLFHTLNLRSNINHRASTNSFLLVRLGGSGCSARSTWQLRHRPCRQRERNAVICSRCRTSTPSRHRSGCHVVAAMDKRRP